MLLDKINTETFKHNSYNSIVSKARLNQIKHEGQCIFDPRVFQWDEDRFNIV